MSLISKSLLASNKLMAYRTLIRSFTSVNNKLSNTLTNTIKSKQSQFKSQFLVLNQLNTRMNYTTEQNEIHKRIDAMIKKSPVVVFMKGTAEQPLCGFSKAVVDILKMHGVEFDTYNVLADENLRNGIKEFTNWPTIPQVFFKGEFIGGCDILLEMHRSGEIIDELKKIGFESKLVE